VPRWLPCALLILCSFPLGAQEAVRYVSDELAVTLRRDRGGDSPSAGVLMSGARVEVLETDPASGYARVRTADGRDGWVLERYLKAQPIARDRLQREERQRVEAEAALRQLQQEHARLKEDYARVTAGRPAPAPEELVRENAALRAAAQDLEQQNKRIRQQYDAERETRNTLVIGGILVGGGFLLALIVDWLRPRRRRWGEL